MSLREVVEGGDRHASLVALRDFLAKAMETCESARDVAALSRQLTDVLAQIDAIPNTAEVSAADEIAQRRAARRSTPTSKARAASPG